MKVTTEVTVIIVPEEMGEEWPDTERKYGLTVIRPDEVIVLLRRNPDDAHYKLKAVSVSGNRVLKDGWCNEQRFSDPYFVGQEAEWPDWLKRAVRTALTAVGQ